MLYAVVEGQVDEAVVRKICEKLRLDIVETFIKGSRSTIERNIKGYIKASNNFPWLVMVDLDDDECPPLLYENWVVNPPENFIFVAVVREIEAWLLADRKNFANYMAVTLDRIPSLPENIKDPKNEVVKLAGYSRKRVIREGMIPNPRSGRRTGIAYNSLLIEYIMQNQTGWDPVEAANRSPSLTRCLNMVSKLNRENNK